MVALQIAIPALLVILASTVSHVHATPSQARGRTLRRMEDPTARSGVMRMLGRDHDKNLFKEDVGFWSRFVQEVASSVTPAPTCPFVPGGPPIPGCPTPPPSPQPTPGPTCPATPGGLPVPGCPTPPPTPCPTTGPPTPGCPTPSPTPCPTTSPPTPGCPTPSPTPCPTTGPPTPGCPTPSPTPCPTTGPPTPGCPTPSPTPCPTTGPPTPGCPTPSPTPCPTTGPPTPGCPTPSPTPCPTTGPPTPGCPTPSPTPRPTNSPTPCPTTGPPTPGCPTPSPTPRPTNSPTPCPTTGPPTPGCPTPSPTPCPTSGPPTPGCPTPSPTPVPSPSPTPCPTTGPPTPGCPTPSPTPCPTFGPPTPGCPTPSPTPCPTFGPPTPGCPTPSPTPCPTFGPPTPGCPTPSPTACPTFGPPTPGCPTPSPTPPPAQCILEMDISCPECEAPTTSVEPCNDRPLEITMLYAGGDCTLSDNCQPEDKFQCIDYAGGPPTTFGEKSYVVATDNDDAVVYYEGWVNVGSTFVMENNMERFPADQIIRVYSSEDKSEASLRQEVFYHSSCSQNLDLLNRFGSFVIVGWFNEVQGYVTGFDNSTFTVNVDIPVTADFEGGGATVTSLTIAQTTTSGEGQPDVPPTFFNLTSSVAGTPLQGGDTFQTEVLIPLNLALKLNYNMLITMTAITASGVECTATELYTFTAGGFPFDLQVGGPCPSELVNGDGGGGGGGGGGGKNDKN